MLKTLIVGEATPTRMTFERLTQSRGHQLSVHDTAETALAAYDAEHYPLVFLCAGGSFQTALQTCRALAARPHRAHSVIAVVTATMHPASLHGILNAGADDYIHATEPVDEAHLAARLVIIERVANDRLLRLWVESELRDQTQVLSSILDSLEDGVVVADANEQLVLVNRAAERIMGVALQSLPATERSAHYGLFLPDQVTPFPHDELPLKRAVCGESTNDVGVFIRNPTTPTGAWLTLSGRPLTYADGTPRGGLVVIRDVTAQRAAEHALRESEERYALAAKGANDGLWDWDIARGCIFFSERWMEMLGIDPATLTASPDEWFGRVHPDDVQKLREDIAAHLNLQTPHFENESRMLHQDGTYRWVLSRGYAVRDATGRATRMAGSHSDVTERKLYDALTGLPNKALLMDRLEWLAARAARQTTAGFALLLFGLDRFKMVNESLGHGVGDQLLVAVSQRLGRLIRPADTFARIGADEFAVLLEECPGVHEATRFADQLQAQLVQPFHVGGETVFSSASIGIALGGGGTVSRPQEIWRKADTAKNRAKAKGRGRHELFDSAMHKRAYQQLQLETDLRQAIERREFRLHYQPILTLATGQLAGFEALVRWYCTAKGNVIAPGEFIPLAEETGLIVGIGDFVLREACRQLAEWRGQHGGQLDLFMAVNLSARQFGQADLKAQIEDTVIASALEPRSIKLEITESVIMEDALAATHTLEQLKALGLQLCIDDFGTGYSSMKYLRDLPLDSLKVDRSFVAKMTEDAANHEIVSTIVRLAHNLGLEVIAEGVETIGMANALQQLGCEYVQGFHYARPLEAEAAQRFIASHPPKTSGSKNQSA